MPKFIALIAVVLASLALPAFASADPTASQVTSPGNPAYITFDMDNPSTLHVTGTTSGGAGNVDLRCYFGTSGPLLASNVSVANGAFSTDVALNDMLLNTTLDYPYPYCTLRAVPTGTVPQAPPNAVTPWAGPSIGWGEHELFRLDSTYAPNTGKIYDYWFARAQSGAENDFESAASCGLCDTFLFQPGSKGRANPIWWANGGLYFTQNDLTGRTAVQVDGNNSYSGQSAYSNGNPGNALAKTPGFPEISGTPSVDPATGNLTVEEHSPFVTCENPAVFPPTAANCAAFITSGVELERYWRTSDNGLQVTMVDHWKSTDGKAHTVDAYYSDTERSVNANIAGREARVDFTWTGDGMKSYPNDSNITPPASVPATMLVKTDASTSDFGDNMNPFGSMTFGSQPSEIKLLNLGNAASKTGEWQARYQRTIPAGGEVSIAVAYSHDFAIASVKDKAKALETAVKAPEIAIESPAEGAPVDTANAHVTGTASAADGKVSVKVNGVGAAMTPDGHWSADVPLNEGANQVLAVASNGLGVTTTAARTVNYTAPQPAAPAPAPAATAPAVAPKTVRCVVPKLRGKKLAAAKRLLQKAHCRIGKVTRKATSKVKPGRVVATRYKAGTRHRAGTRIRVTIAKARRA